MILHLSQQTHYNCLYNMQDQTDAADPVAEIVVYCSRYPMKIIVKRTLKDIILKKRCLLTTYYDHWFEELSDLEISQGDCIIYAMLGPYLPLA